MNNIFDRWNEWVNDTEGSIVNFLTAFAPWLAPLAPAFMTYQHMVTFLKFPELLAFSLAALVEILGFGTVSTFLDFWFYNRREKAGAKKAPLGVVIASFAFYLMLILVSNVVIDITNAYLSADWQKGAVILVRALLTLQTIPGAMIVAVRTGHRDLLKEIKKEKLEKDKESFQKVSNEPAVSESNFPKDWRKLRPTLTNEDVLKLANLTSQQVLELAKRHHVDARTVNNWRTYARKELGHE